MNTIEKLREFKWINKRCLESMFNIPKGTLRPNSNRAIPQKYLDLIEQEFNKFNEIKPNIIEINEHSTPVSYKLTKKQQKKIKEIIKLSNTAKPMNIDQVTEILKADSIEHVKEVINSNKPIEIKIGSEWNNEFTYKVIKIKDNIIDNMSIKVIDGNGNHYIGYSKNNLVIDKESNDQMRWTYLPKAYLI